MEPEFPWPRAPKSEMCSIPVEWLKPIWKSLKKRKRNPYEKMLYSLLRQQDYLLNKSGRPSGCFLKPLAIGVCEEYIKTVDKTQWPLLIGINSAMDEVLGQVFKKGKP